MVAGSNCMKCACFDITLLGPLYARRGGRFREKGLFSPQGEKAFSFANISSELFNFRVADTNDFFSAWDAESITILHDKSQISPFSRFFPFFAAFFRPHSFLVGRATWYGNLAMWIVRCEFRFHSSIVLSFFPLALSLLWGGNRSCHSRAVISDDFLRLHWAVVCLSFFCKWILQFGCIFKSRCKLVGESVLRTIFDWCICKKVLFYLVFVMHRNAYITPLMHVLRLLDKKPTEKSLAEQFREGSRSAQEN